MKLVNGVIANNKLSWWHHLNGDFSDPKKPIPGLISQLSKRVGLLSRLWRLLPQKKFESFTNGIFYSKLIYCLPLFGNVFDVDNLQDTETRCGAFTKANLQTLQVLQNKIIRMLTSKGYDTPVKELLLISDHLSINQLVAFTTIMTFFKIRLTKEPFYLARRMGMFDESVDLIAMRTRHGKDSKRIEFDLSRAREGFLYRGSFLWSLLPPSLQKEKKVSKFRKALKDWIKLKIPALPR